MPKRLAGVSVRAARLALVTSILALDKLMDSEDGDANLR